uniref:Uncharacterized protein n=1 Tax=Halalkalibacterium halodurans TaxID=86665 RepID=A0A0M0KMB4_ALKHA
MDDTAQPCSPVEIMGLLVFVFASVNQSYIIINSISQEKTVMVRIVFINGIFRKGHRIIFTGGGQNA